MTSRTKCVKFNMSQPADWHEAFKKQAAKEGMQLSPWMAECCFAYLPKSIQAELSDRHTVGRPSKKESK